MEHLTDSERENIPGGSTQLGTNQSGMREQNERLVLTLLRRSSGLASAEVARRTGLSAQTVSRLIRALEADQLIRRGAPQRGRVGQPSVPLSLNPTGAFFLGLKVGRRSLELVLTDFLGTIIDREKQIHSYPDFDNVLAFTVSGCGTIRNRLAPALRGRLAGMGIAMPFHLWNWAAQIGVDPARMANWETRDLGAELAERIDLPLFVQNDATAACSAELVFGASPRPPNFLSFFVAFFIGGGLVLRGSLYTGATGNAAGLGPLVVPDTDGRMLPLIELASLSKLERRLVEMGQDATHIWNDAEGWDIPEAALEDWLDHAAPALAHAVLAAQALLDLDAILLDGWLPRRVLADLRVRVEAALDGLDLSGIRRPAIRSGTIGADARALGAASLPLSARFLVD
ncbi:ROK family transcriptional regulator [Roseibacterium sp. SDUM158016]|uniref:ROK family transcriptional regulator n=1 Tax=Roseicyclus sediminis TaxID=2980997 RepID=UPI0021CF3D9F|nr:ROK family transcriptional regulator [Roseibacterium sp. SDUM158016]MCU4653426.1 ROK family transcriptional regulator [Roseibacterium sp. SDUM158016]